MISLVIGNFAALAQRSVKRLLAYSSVSQAGFMLIAIAADNELGGKALLFYLIPYGAASIGAFAVVAARERELGRAVTLTTLEGWGWERPFYGAAMWVFMLTFAGFPFTGGMIGKFYVFSAAYEAGWWWLIVIGVIATAISIYYYLAIVRAMYMRTRLGTRRSRRRRRLAASRPCARGGDRCCRPRRRRHVLLRSAADRRGDEGRRLAAFHLGRRAGRRAQGSGRDASRRTGRRELGERLPCAMCSRIRNRP